MKTVDRLLHPIEVVEVLTSYEPQTPCSSIEKMRLTITLSRADLEQFFQNLVSPELPVPDGLEWLVSDFESDEDGDLASVTFEAEYSETKLED